jgi:hypothetical protein
VEFEKRSNLCIAYAALQVNSKNRACRLWYAERGLGRCGYFFAAAADYAVFAARRIPLRQVV